MKQRLMRKQPTRAAALLLTLALAALTGCAGKPQDNIVVLYTNDIHCAVDAQPGFAGLAAYRTRVEEQTPYVALVDCGDALQGDAMGAVSQGAYLVEIMNEAGYDFAVLGNHEFDYGMEQLSALLEQAQAQYLGCNIRYTGSGDSALSALADYEIVSYGNTKVAFVGVSTPESIVKSTPTYFMDETGSLVYDFCGGSGEELYQQVQETVDRCREEGADYVIALTHLGCDDASAPFRSTDLIAGTTGIDAVLDGHSHSVIPCEIIQNQEGDEVLLSSTGTGLTNIGQLVITPSGTLTTGLIGAYPKTDEALASYIQDMESRYEAELSQVVAHTDVPLTTRSDTGVRLVRSRETNLGDFCADAYRAVSGAEIALVNGGGIRADLSAGEITYGDLIAVHPHGNGLCVVQATGQEILDALEMASRTTESEVSDGTNAVGENGGFLQVSGLKYTIHTAVTSTVEVDENGMFLSCGDNRRVGDVEVLQEDGSYAPLDPAQTYTVASHNYLLKEGGDGINVFMDNPLTLDEGMSDYQVLMTYLLDTLQGVVPLDYAQPQGRITVR